nr:uncharacterized protein LOC124810150 isoform X1 [Hydra vulgaris]
MACKRSSDEPSECNSFFQSSKRMGQVATMNYIVYLYCDSEVLELKNCDIIMPEKLKSWSMDDWRSRGQTLTEDDLQIKAIHKDCVNSACILQISILYTCWN